MPGRANPVGYADQMRTLVLLSSRGYVRDFLSAGAFDDIEGDETFFALGADAARTDEALQRPDVVGVIEMPEGRRAGYRRIRGPLMTSYRFRSRTAKIKHAALPPVQRWRAAAEALPGIRHARIAMELRRLGLNASLEEMLDRLRPDLIISPSQGLDSLAVDAARSGHARGMPVIGLMYNWDNLSSKAAFATPPDYLGVVGRQSAEHAELIHGFSRARVGILGSPYIDRRYFHHELGSTRSPFDFPYVLFAGCYQPFDERSTLEALDQEVERRALGLKIVYLPHPHRLRREIDDFVDEAEFRHVVIHPQMREQYVKSHAGRQASTPDRLRLDDYPPLIENAEFVVCPLSTMMLEAAIIGKRVLVIGYHDGVHSTSPGVAIDYLHFERIDELPHVEVCRESRDVAKFFTRMANEPWTATRPPKEVTDYWIYHDDRPFSRRLADFVDEVAEREGLANRRGHKVAGIV